MNSDPHNSQTPEGYPSGPGALNEVYTGNDAEGLINAISRVPSTAAMPGVELSSTSPAGSDPSAGISENQSWTRRADLSNPVNLRLASQAPDLPTAEPCVTVQTQYEMQVACWHLNVQPSAPPENDPWHP